MKKEDIIRAELDTLSTLAHLERKLPYCVPGQYFDTLHDVILQRIYATESASLTGLNYQPTFAVPAGYFDTLSAQIKIRIDKRASELSANDELASVAPLLASLQKTNVYTVPERYFSSNHFVHAAQKPTGGRIVNLKVWKWAVAAAVATVLAVGAFLLGQDNTSPANGKAYSEIKKLSEDDIADFLSPAGEQTNGRQFVQQATDIHEAVKQLPDDEIKQFLQESELQEGI